MKRLDSKKVTLLNNFLDKSDIDFILNNLGNLHFIRNEDDTFFRDVYTAERTDKEFSFLFDKCDAAVKKACNEKLIGHQLYFIKYNVGDYIKRHNDIWQTYTSAGRVYSLVAQMTNPDDYEGGNTIIYDENGPVVLSKQLGDGVIFPSSMDHELTEITKGERFSLVIMFKSPDKVAI